MSKKRQKKQKKAAGQTDFYEALEVKDEETNLRRFDVSPAHANLLQLHAMHDDQCTWYCHSQIRPMLVLGDATHNALEFAMQSLESYWPLHACPCMHPDACALSRISHFWLQHNI